MCPENTSRAILLLKRFFAFYEGRASAHTEIPHKTIPIGQSGVIGGVIQGVYKVLSTVWTHVTQ